MARTALVTGGMGGLGSAICKALADAGNTVLVTYLGNEEKATQWHNEAKADGYSFPAYKCDVSDFDSCISAFSQIKQHYPNIDILVNNAGITSDATFKKMTKEAWDLVIDTNLDSMFNVTKQVIDGMLDNKWGRIINISSLNGQKGQFGQVNYSASKAAIHGFTMALAQETASKGITVNTIAPGYIATEMVMAIAPAIREKIIQSIPLGRLGKPEEIGALVSYLASDMAAFITGSEIAINGGQHMM
jgi:acetoacetyl-CoA reductase